MTQSPGNWPDPERPGVPMFPERDGWHWVDTGLASGMRPFFWRAKFQSWLTSADPWGHRWKHIDSWKYLGIDHTPAQISEMLAAERERCAIVLDRLKNKEQETYGIGLMTTRAEITIRALALGSEEIRNLGAAP